MISCIAINNYFTYCQLAMTNTFNIFMIRIVMTKGSITKVESWFLDFLLS